MKGKQFWKGKQVLVTGATGFVGSLLVYRLLDHGASVLGTKLSKLNKNDDLPGVEIVRNNCADFPSLFELIETRKPDIIFHLAAQSSVQVSIAEPYETTKTNVLALTGILESLRKLQSKARLVHIGSADVYGRAIHSKEDMKWYKSNHPYYLFGKTDEVKSELPLKETAPLRPLSPYASSRAHNEMILHNYVNLYGLDAVATRSFNHEGFGRGANFVTGSIIQQVKELQRGEREEMSIGNVSTFRDWSYVWDMIEAYMSLAEKGKSGEIYNCGSGKANSVATFLLLALEATFGKVLSIRGLEGKNKFQNPLKLESITLFQKKAPQTALDIALLTGKYEFKINPDKSKTCGFIVETASKDIRVVFDKSKIRQADIPILIADTAKVSKLGVSFKTPLSAIIAEMLDPRQMVENLRRK
ncbi:MAG: GDP-mannose 4,6-dehydratase [Chloroherpetonaceae bacterium]|nr:GDP-mannose 4,6-dehydratase [Chloroherpetonaceae bacterium]